MTKAEQAYILRIKSMPCCVCGASAPSDAHHIMDCGHRISHFMVLPLCKSCHQDNEYGIHGRRTMWKIMKMNELDALALVVAGLVVSK